jgi:predicted AlkP superfamily pyrophosphatase or phosphodiesterase
MGACRVGAVLLAAQLAVAGFAHAQAAEPPPRPPRSHVVLISLDGLYPEIYRRSAELGLQMPHLSQLVREGASADGMLGIFPTATYPSHATLITGVRPARHGIVSNSVFTPARKLPPERPIAAGGDSASAAAAATNAGTDAATGGESAWYWYADSLRAPCLPQVVTAAGYSVAVSNWPVLVGAPWVRWHLPEIWSLGSGDASSRDKTLRWATPGLVAEVEKRFAPWTDARFEWGAQDVRITDGAVTLLESKRPQLLLVHLVEVDHVLHQEGRNAPAALRAFEAADRQIGRILAALGRAGLRDSTDVVVVGDHGFTNVHTEVRPNVALAEIGLLTPGAARSGQWRALARTTTAVAAIYVQDPADTAAAGQAQRHFQALAAGRYAGLFTVVDRAALDRYGAFPGAAFAIACAPGFACSGRDQGSFTAAVRSRGMHGYRPEEPSMLAGFVACGPDFAAAMHIPQIRMVDVAPTLATVLGVDLGPQVEGIAVPGILRSRDAAGRSRATSKRATTGKPGVTP